MVQQGQWRSIQKPGNCLSRLDRVWAAVTRSSRYLIRACMN